MRIIGFDFDGVFTNIETEKAALFGSVLEKHWSANPLHAADLWLMSLGTSRRYKFDLIYKQKFQKELSDDLYAEIEQEFSKRLMHDYYPNAKIIPETVETAKNFTKQFDLAFISSGIPHVELNAIAARFNIDPFFDLILGTSDHFKSKADHFRIVIQNSTSYQGIFIGDGLEDMKIAKRFNFIGVGLPANHPAQELMEAGANITCEFSELQKTVANLLTGLNSNQTYF